MPRPVARSMTSTELFLSLISEISSGGSHEISVPAAVSSAVIFRTQFGGNEELLKFRFDGFSMIGLVDPTDSTDPTVGWVDLGRDWVECILFGFSVRTATCVLSNSILKNNKLK